jgi:malonyl-CoA/methylmalonyl-CoA synthetase
MRFLPRFDIASVLHFLPETTVFMGVPTYYTRPVAGARFRAGCVPSIRLFVSGSATASGRDLSIASARSRATRSWSATGLTETLMNSSKPTTW